MSCDGGARVGAICSVVTAPVARPAVNHRRRRGRPRLGAESASRGNQAAADSLGLVPVPARAQTSDLSMSAATELLEWQGASNMRMIRTRIAPGFRGPGAGALVGRNSRFLFVFAGIQTNAATDAEMALLRFGPGRPISSPLIRRFTSGCGPCRRCVRPPPPRPRVKGPDSNARVRAFG